MNDSIDMVPIWYRTYSATSRYDRQIRSIINIIRGVGGVGWSSVSHVWMDGTWVLGGGGGGSILRMFDSSDVFVPGHTTRAWMRVFIFERLPSSLGV